MDCYLEGEIGPKKYICFFHVFFLNFEIIPGFLNIIDDAEGEAGLWITDCPLMIRRLVTI